jgi:hypothetical protein
VPSVHVNYEAGWFIADLPEGFTNTGYAFVELSEDEYEDYKCMLAHYKRWQDKLENIATEGGKHHPFTRYYVNGVEQ